MISIDLTEVRRLLKDPTIEIFVQPGWGSDVPAHRDLIRENMKASKKGRGKSWTDFSVSHAQGLGGYAITASAHHQIGFDIESADRASLKTITRVSTAAERPSWGEPGSPAVLPSTPTHLWVAKEAGFKVLKGPSQPQTTSQVIITDWKTPKSQFETFCIEHSQNSEISRATGVVFPVEDFIFCLTVVSFKKAP